jgi:TolB protein
MDNEIQIRPIIFSSACDGDEDIYIMDITGKVLRRCTTSTQKGVTNRTPEWAPNGQQFVFQSNRDGQAELYTFDVAPGETTRLTHTPNNGRSMQPSWSPDGKQIVFCSDRGAGTQLFIINSDGTDERRFVPSGLEERQFWNPDWTPDGKSISFIVRAQSDENDALWSAAIDGSNPTQISPANLSVFEYDFAQNGREVVFDVRLDRGSLIGDWDIFKMAIDGSNVQRLTDHPAISSRPKWLSDGKTIVFHTNRFGTDLKEPVPDAPLETWFAWWNQFEVCLMDADGSNVLRLTSNNLRDLHPDG